MLGVLFAARVVMGFQFQSVASAAPSLTAQLGLGPGQIGTLIGLYMLPGVVIALPGGLLARRLGEKWTCLLGLALMVVGGCLAGNAASFAGIALGRAVSGVGGVIFNLVLTSMVAGWFADAEIVTAMAILLASWPAAIAAALISETALSLRYGWAMVAYAVAALCLTAWAAVALLYSPYPDRPASAQARDRLSFSRPEVTSCAFAGLLWGAFNTGLVIFCSFTPQLLAQRGCPPVEAGSATSLGLWITIVSLPLGGWGVETLRRPHTGIVASCIAAAVVMAALPILPWPMISGFGLGLAIGPGAGAIVGLPARMVSPTVARSDSVFSTRLLRRDGHWSRSGRLGTENLGHRRRVASRRKRPVSGRRTASGGSRRVIGVERNASLKANRYIAELRSSFGGHPIPPFECSCAKLSTLPAGVAVNVSVSSAAAGALKVLLNRQ
jgi:predicted MFS family arabinose efflux permease